MSFYYSYYRFYFYTQIPAFDCCTACSSNVINEYRLHGSDFIHSVCNDATGKIVEGISGITDLMKRLNKDNNNSNNLIESDCYGMEDVDQEEDDWQNEQFEKKQKCNRKYFIL